jgi:hypothetical protein
MCQRAIVLLFLSVFCLLGGCVLADDFSEPGGSEPGDRRALLDEQLPTLWAALVTSPSIPNAGLVYMVEFRDGGTQTVDVGLVDFEGTWVITETNAIELKFSGPRDQDDIVAEATIVDGIVVSLSVEVGFGLDQTLVFRRVDRSALTPDQLHGEWRTRSIDEVGPGVGTEFDAVSYYGVYNLEQKKRYFKGDLTTFPCGSARSCWAFADAKFAADARDDENNDISGNPSPLLGGTIQVEGGQATGIYLPIFDDGGVKKQALALPKVL